MCVRKVYDLETLSRGAKRRRKRVVLMARNEDLLTKNLEYMKQEELKVSQEELHMFNEKIVKRFESDFKEHFKGQEYMIAKNASETLEIKYQLELQLISENEAKRNQNIFSEIKPRQIIMVGNNEFPYHYLYRHLNNCVQKPDEKIFKMEIENEIYYDFTDSYPKVETISMRALIPVDVFENYIDDIFHWYKEFHKKQIQ